MFKELWGLPTNELPPEARDWVRSQFASAILTVKEIQDKYKLSQPTISRLYTKHDWSFAFKKGSQLLFIAEFAIPWFDQYQRSQNDNRSKQKTEPESKPKVKKVKKGQEWRNTVFNGWEINIPEEFESPKKWVEHIHRIEMKKYQFYPAYQSAEHMAWLETWRALKQHFGITEVNLCI